MDIKPIYTYRLTTDHRFQNVLMKWEGMTDWLAAAQRATTQSEMGCHISYGYYEIYFYDAELATAFKLRWC